MREAQLKCWVSVLETAAHELLDYPDASAMLVMIANQLKDEEPPAPKNPWDDIDWEGEQH